LNLQKRIASHERRDLLEILNDRYYRRSTLITSQLPVEQWHARLEDPTPPTLYSIGSSTTAIDLP
jgi:DNA replication protein DnaC